MRKAPENMDFKDVLNFSRLNLSMAEWWPTFDTEFTPINDPSDPIPDIAPWIDSSLVLSPKAFRLLGDLLKPWGEFLPVTILQGETWYIFNCLTFGEIIEEQCEMSYYEGEEFGVKTIVYDEADIKDKLIYKNRYNQGLEMCCGDRFKGAVEAFGLSGLRFSTKIVEDFNSPP